MLEERMSWKSGLSLIAPPFSHDNIAFPVLDNIHTS